MNFESFLRDKADDGVLDSEGQFSVDLSKASAKIAEFALPTVAHYVLKVIQVAHRLKAESIYVKIGRYGTTVEFEVLRDNLATAIGSVQHSLADPVGTEDLTLKDLVAAIYGTLNPTHKQTSWSCRQGGRGERIVVDSQRRVRIERFQEGPTDDPLTATFEVLYANPWAFWKSASQRAATASLLREKCSFSAARLFLDGAELETPKAWTLNAHVARPLGIKTEHSLAPTGVAASNILFQLAGEDDPALSLLRPSLSAFLVRSDVMNVWASGTRVNNTMEPDGLASAAWMLQFRRDEENLSMRWVRKRDTYSCVLAVNIENYGSDSPFRLKRGCPRRCGIWAGDQQRQDRFLSSKLKELVTCQQIWNLCVDKRNVFARKAVSCGYSAMD